MRLPRSTTLLRVSMNRASVDVAIIGAGPYGLSLATHLADRGIEHRIFGRPMQAWRSMPAGMFLKSLGFATTIPTPGRHPTLPEYCSARGLEDYDPIEIATFARYGVSVQQDLVPYAEDAEVAELNRIDSNFALRLQTGERIRARRVIVATGLSHFEQIPELLSGLPEGLVSHSAHHSDFSRFARQRVAVLGAGQSALQAAALLRKAGAETLLLARKDIVWGGSVARRRPLVQRMRAPNTVVGLGKGKWILEHIPMLLHYMPDTRRLSYNQTKLGPAGAWWLREEVERQVPMLTRTSLISAREHNGDVRLRVRQADGCERELVFDHVVAGTGFCVDVDRIGFIANDLASQISRLDRAPRLSRNFESSVSDLYFIGPASVASFGPLFRFVAGAAYTVPHLAGHLASRSLKPSAPRQLVPQVPSRAAS